MFELSAALLKNEPLQRAQKLQKGYKAYTQVNWTNITFIRGKNLIPGQISFQTQHNWTQTPESTLKVCSICHDLCESSLEAYATVGDGSKASVLSQLSSARLTTQGCVKAVKSSEWEDQCKEQLPILEAFLETIKETLLANA